MYATDNMHQMEMKRNETNNDCRQNKKHADSVREGKKLHHQPDILFWCRQQTNAPYIIPLHFCLLDHVYRKMIVRSLFSPAQSCREYEIWNADVFANVSVYVRPFSLLSLKAIQTVIEHI